MDKVSVIIPVYNPGNSIRACIDSVLQQDYENLEIILVDDGSNDFTPGICDQYAEKDKRIQVFHREHAGVSAARNYGLRQATGDYIVFWDSDDTVKRNAISDNLKLAQATGADIVIYGCRYHYVDENAVKENMLDSFAGTAQEFFEKYYIKYLKAEVLNPPWNKLIRYQLLRQERIYFHEAFSICEDMAFTAQLLRVSNRIAVNKELYYNYNIKRKGSLVFQFHHNFFDALLYFYENATDYCNRFPERKMQQREVDSIYVKKTMMFIKKICYESGWDKKTRIRHIREICNQKIFRKAMKYAELERKKEILRILIYLRWYGLIYLLYQFILTVENICRSKLYNE